MARRTAKLPDPPASKKKATKKRAAKKAPAGRVKKKLTKAERNARLRAGRAAKKAAKKSSTTTKTVKAKDATMTLAQVHQCLVLQANPDISPAEFARKAWPDAEGWKKKIRTGTGPHSDKVVEREGGAMNVAAGAALGKLKGLGWATFVLDENGRTKRYSLTKTGEKALEKSRKAYEV